MVIVLLVIIAVIIAIVLTNPELINFSSKNVGDYTNLLTPLFLIALFMERGLEVFMTVWRGAETSNKELSLRQAKAVKAVNDPSIHEQEQKLQDYQNETRKISLAVSLCLGIIISSVGIRALELFLNAESFGKLKYTTQWYLFHVIDVLITGAMLGGGSDGIHKIVSTLTTFMDSTKKNIKQ